MKLINTITGKKETYKDFDTINSVMGWPKKNRKTEIGIWKVVEDEEKVEVVQSNSAVSFLFEDLDDFWNI